MALMVGPSGYVLGIEKVGQREKVWSHNLLRASMDGRYSCS